MTAQRLRARELIELVVDDDSFESWDAPPVTPAEMTEEYAAELTAARDRSGVDEAVITGESTIHGRRAAAVACEFAFHRNLGLP